MVERFYPKHKTPMIVDVNYTPDPYFFGRALVHYPFTGSPSQL